MSVPTSSAAGAGLVLDAPRPVSLVTDEEASTAVPIDQAKQEELNKRARNFAAELSTLEPNSPEFTKKVDSITSMGATELRASASVSNRILDRPTRSLQSGKGKLKGEDAQSRVAGTLTALRVQVSELDPSRADLGGAKKLLKWMPGGDKVAKYFAKYESAQTQLNAIIKSLASGQDELRKDNAAIETEKVNMWNAMQKLGEYQVLAAALDTAVEEKVAELETAGQSESAKFMRSDALFAVRQRRQDIMTQLAVSAQGYMALDLVRKNNIELIKGVDRAQTTTISALRTAVIVSVALNRQKLVLDQVNALNATTSNMIEATSNQLRIQGAAINEQAASATIDVQKLQAAFDNVFQTMDAIDTFRAQATDTMQQTVVQLEGQLERAKPYLERTRKAEGNG